jgi:arylsulfatase A-like enzyme
VDRLLSSLLTDDRVVVITGDHGESFLDDGTIGHGIRVSEFQNMTPAIIGAPNIEPRVVDEPTMHADLLPTLLGILGIPLNDPSVLDGVDLLTTTEIALRNRTFVTRDYLSEKVAVISSRRDNANNVFASTGSVSLKRFHTQPSFEIDRNGDLLDLAANQVFNNWLTQRFGSHRPTGSVLEF